MLEIHGLHASVAGKPILTGVNLELESGQIHAIMGPNGSGKSTLGNVLMGSPKCTVTAGEVVFKGEDLLSMAPDERARKGVFLAFQHPLEVQGLKFLSLLKRATESRGGEKQSLVSFRKVLEGEVSELSLPTDFASREVNYGFSGGEKKRAEILQLAVLKPGLALLDEIDSGLDVDTLRTTARKIVSWHKQSGAPVVLMTHYKRILDHIKPDFVHVMVGGRIVKSGGFELAEKIDSQGYAGFDSGPSLSPTSAGGEKDEFYSSLLKQNKQKVIEAPRQGKIGLTQV